MLHLEITGKVIPGEALGRKLGYPTANLDRRDYVRRKLKVRLGVYAGVAEFMLRAKCYVLNAAIIIGPLDKKGLPKIEAHLLGFKGNLYGKRITLKPVKFLRPFKKFASSQELIKQIGLDMKKVKAIL